jgi:hypothetical protein
MSSKLFEDLARSHPDLMQKSEIGQYLGVGDGWYNLIDILCGLISNRVENLRSMLNYALEKDTGKAAELEEKLAVAIEELPVIVQVKEKFGGLRFYVQKATSEHYAYIEFAEAMSYRTCEDCGDRGSSRQGGWIKVRCDRHHREFEEAHGIHRGNLQTKPNLKLSDEEIEES